MCIILPVQQNPFDGYSFFVKGLIHMGLSAILGESQLLAKLAGMPV